MRVDEKLSGTSKTVNPGLPINKLTRFDIGTFSSEMSLGNSRFKNRIKHRKYMEKCEGEEITKLKEKPRFRTVYPVKFQELVGHTYLISLQA